MKKERFFSGRKACFNKMQRRNENMLNDWQLVFKNQTDKKRYADLEVEISYFEESFIRTSIGNDGNNDGDWDDENARPSGAF